MSRYPGVPFVPPRSFSPGRPEGPPRFIVIHYTAGHEGPTAAEDGASYDQRRGDGTSAHFHVDRDSIIQCVDTADRSHTALYHGNAWGIHIEQAGTLQTRAQWLDAASRATIRNTAKVCAWAMRVHDIPLVRLVSAQVRTGRGICGHVDCTTGFPEDGGTHTDPGPEYPWDVLFADIRDEMEPDVELTDKMDDYVGFPTTVGKVLASAYTFARGADENAKAAKTAALDAKALAVDGAQQAAVNGASLSELKSAVSELAGALGELITKVDSLAVTAGDPDAVLDALHDRLTE